MAMDPKQLGALVSREKKKTDARSRPALRHYDVPGKHAGKKDLPKVEMTGDDEEQDSALRAFVHEQQELAEKHNAAPDAEDELPEVPTTALSDLLE